MKLFFLIFIVFFSFGIVNSQEIMWDKSYGGSHADYLFDIQSTADYGFILAGSSLSNKSGNKSDDNHGDLDYCIWKMDEKGTIDWQKSFGGSGFDLLQSIRNTKDGGFFLSGTSNSPIDFQKKDSCKGNTDFWVIKLNAKGEEQWQKTIGGSDQDELICGFQTRDGGYILGGSSSSNSEFKEKIGSINKKSIVEKPDLFAKAENSRGNMDYWIVKLDNLGTIQWQKTYGGENADLLRSMEQTSDGGYIIGGYSNSPVSGDKTDANIGVGDYWIIKTNDLGEIEWQKTYGGDGDNQLYVIHQTNDGGYIAGGNSNSIGSLTFKGGIVSNGTDYWVLKTDQKGEVEWSHTYDFGKVDILTSLVENNDYTYLIGGYVQSEDSNIALKSIKKDKEGINDYIAIKINNEGDEIWNKTVGSTGEDILRKLIETRDGGYLMAGTSNSNSSKDKNSNIGSNDFWVVKLKDKTKVEKVKATVEAIPNPASTFTNIIIGYEFENGTATLVDMAGRILQQFTINSRTVPVDLSRYPVGVYIVNIKTNIQSDGVKVIKKLN